MYIAKLSSAAVVGCLLTMVVACSAPPIERLHGEPKAADAFTKARNPAPGAADAINRFIASVRAGQVEQAYEQLSKKTRMALEARARTTGLRGIDLLRPAGPNVSPAARKFYVTDAIATFAMTDLKTIRVGERPWPAGKPHDGTGLTWIVELVSKSGKTRQVKLVFEGVLWRIHNPSLKM
ncbi:MAG: hypothetical protein KC502_06570 [Myxococcales bacterium]|nr:hypothetical protein [Myxococcales bacterium]